MNKLMGKHYLSEMTPTIICLWILFIVPIITFLPLIFNMISSHEFLGAGPIAVILFIVIPGEIVTQLYGALFKVQGRLVMMKLVYHTISTITNLIISVVLLFFYGVIGSAIGTAVSYLMCQFFYFNDQHRFLKVPSFKINLLFVMIVVFGVGQAFLGNFGIYRLSFSILFLVCYIIFVRYFSVVSAETIEVMFGGSFPRISCVLKKTLVV